MSSVSIDEQLRSWSSVITSVLGSWPGPVSKQRREFCAVARASGVTVTASYSHGPLTRVFFSLHF